LKNIAPDFIASITLYPSDKGGRHYPIVGEWYGCPCKFDPQDFSGMVFLSPEAATMFRKVGKFYLWEGHIIGEATAIVPRNQTEALPGNGGE